MGADCLYTVAKQRIFSIIISRLGERKGNLLVTAVLRHERLGYRFDAAGDIGS